MGIDPAETSDLRLPDDLQFLGEQLWEDAGHLARTYPANAPKNWRRAFAAAVVQRADPSRAPGKASTLTAGGGRSALFGGVAAAALTAVVATAWHAADVHPPGGAVDKAATAGHARPETQQGQPISAGAGFMPSLDESLWRIPVSQPKVVPLGAESLELLSAPEQEAFIDAMNEKRIREPSVPY